MGGSRAFTDLLGIHLDSRLNWKEHVNKVTFFVLWCTSCSKKIASPTIAPFKVRKLSAESLILSKLDYCNIISTHS